jgi:hypothetical protein
MSKNRIAGYGSQVVWWLDRRGELVVGNMAHAELIAAECDDSLRFVRMHCRVGNSKRLRVVDRPAFDPEQLPARMLPPGDHPLDVFPQEVDVPADPHVQTGAVTLVAGSSNVKQLFAAEIPKLVRVYGRVWLVKQVTIERLPHRAVGMRLDMVRTTPADRRGRKTVNLAAWAEKHGLVEYRGDRRCDDD